MPSRTSSADSHSTLPTMPQPEKRGRILHCGAFAAARGLSRRAAAGVLEARVVVPREVVQVPSVELVDVQRQGAEQVEVLVLALQGRQRRERSLHELPEQIEATV